MRICGMACVRDSHDLVAASINHLALNGIGDFYLFDHASDPDLASFLSSALYDGGIRLQMLRKESTPFFQRAMMTALAELARMDGFEIAVAFDADEFWCSTVEGRSLAEQIAVEMPAGLDALRVPVINYVQHRDVDTFRLESLQRCRYSVAPCAESALHPAGEVDAGLPFVAVPFPSKMIARLSPDVRYDEGQHGISKTNSGVRVTDASGIAVRHLHLPSREEVAAKRQHGVNRIAGGYAFDIGWQSQRLAYMTEGELDAYWRNNSWQLSANQRARVGTYDALTADDALVQIGQDLALAARTRSKPRASAADEDSAFGQVPARRLEHLVQSLVDLCGTTDVSEEEEEVRLDALQMDLDERTSWAQDLADEVRERNRALRVLQLEFEERTAWALRLNEQLAAAHQELAAVKTSFAWRVHRAARNLHSTFRTIWRRVR